MTMLMWLCVVCGCRVLLALLDLLVPVETMVPL